MMIRMTILRTMTRTILIITTTQVDQVSECGSEKLDDDDDDDHNDHDDD